MMGMPLLYGSMPCRPMLRSSSAFVWMYKKLQYSSAVRLHSRIGRSMGTVLPVLSQ